MSMLLNDASSFEIMKHIAEEMPLITLLMPIVLAFTFVSWVFLIGYIFFFKKMRVWFNNTAGMDFVPEKRIGNPQMIAAGAGIVILVAMFFSSDTGYMIQNILWLILIVWSIVTFVKTKRTNGTKAAFWVTIYLFLSCLAVATIATVLSAFVIVIYAVIFFMDKVAPYVASSALGGHGVEGGNAAKAGSGSSGCTHLTTTKECRISGGKCPAIQTGVCPIAGN